MAVDGDPGSQPAVCAHQPDRLSDWLQRRGRHVEGRSCAAWRALRCAVPLSTRFLVAALSQPAALMQAISGRDSLPRREPAARRSSCWIRVDASGAPAARSAGLAAYGLRRRTAGLSIAVRRGQPFRAQLTDLAPGGSITDLSGSSPATYKASRPQFYLAVGPQDVSFRGLGCVNGATFHPGIAPGGVVSIFGAGLSGPGKATTVDMDGTPLRLLLATPFQINAEVPLGMAPGVHSLARAIGLRVGAAVGYGFGGGTGYLLDWAIRQ